MAKYKATKMQAGTCKVIELGAQNNIVLAEGMTTWTAERIAELLNKWGLSTKYDQISYATGVSREDVKKVLLAAAYSG